MQVAPKDGISNFCEWLSGFGPQCPIWFTWDKLQPYLPIFFGALVVGGIVWFFWPQSRTQKSELALRLREIEAQEVTAAAMQRHAEALESQDSSSVLNRMRARFDLEGRINAEKELAGESRAKLIISGPHRLKDSKYISQVYWRMRAYNDGPAAAANVQMK